MFFESITVQVIFLATYYKSGGITLLHLICTIMCRLCYLYCGVSTALPSTFSFIYLAGSSHFLPATLLNTVC